MVRVFDTYDDFKEYASRRFVPVCDEHVGLYKLFSSICTRQHVFLNWCVFQSVVRSAKSVRVCDDVLFDGSRGEVLEVPVWALFGIYKWFLERIGEPQLLGDCESFKHFKESMHVFMRKLDRCSRGGEAIRMDMRLCWCYFVDVRLVHETLCKHAYFDGAVAARGDIWIVDEYTCLFFPSETVDVSYEFEHVGLYKLFSSICTWQHEFLQWCVKESNMWSAKCVGSSGRDVLEVPLFALFEIYKWFLERIGEPQLLGDCESVNHFKEKMHVFKRTLHRCSPRGKAIRMHSAPTPCYFVDVRLVHETLCKHAFFDGAVAARGDIWCVYE